MLIARATGDTPPDGVAGFGNILQQSKVLVTDRYKTFFVEVTEYEWEQKASRQGHDEVFERNDRSIAAAQKAFRLTIWQWQHETYELTPS